jgi:hypothetical protein
MLIVNVRLIGFITNSLHWISGTGGVNKWRMLLAVGVQWQDHVQASLSISSPLARTEGVKAYAASRDCVRSQLLLNALKDSAEDLRSKMLSKTEKNDYLARNTTRLCIK